MRFALVICALAALQPVWAATAEDSVTATLGKRLFPVVSSLNKSQAPAAVRSMLDDREHRLDRCIDDAACKLGASIWSADEISVATRLDAKRADDIRRELVGLNSILNVYGNGATPRYPKIDGPLGQQGSERLATDVAVAMAIGDVGRNETVTAFDRSIGLALALLDVNNRLEAIAFEPITGGLNQAAFQRSQTLDWSRFPHTAIIVLGAGPDDLLTPLSARGKLHIKVAAQRYFAGLAPFIILSGGAVHPRDTRAVEAIEMRRALIERYAVPENAIVIEPYARHTTTNLRNATRLLIAMKAPNNREALVVSDPRHIDSVQSAEFVTRNQNELGYQPGKIGKRTSPFDVTFLPSADSLRVDPLDPLDP